jgi:hypothetical protein
MKRNVLRKWHSDISDIERRIRLQRFPESPPPQSRILTPMFYLNPSSTQLVHFYYLILILETGGY